MKTEGGRNGVFKGRGEGERWGMGNGEWKVMLDVRKKERVEEESERKGRNEGGRRYRVNKGMGKKGRTEGKDGEWGMEKRFRCKKEREK